MMKYYRLLWPLFVGLLLFSGGCAPYIDRQADVAPQSTQLLTPGHPVGQTFVARHNGLTSFEIWLSPSAGGQAELRFHLRSGPDTNVDLTSSTLPLQQITTPGFYRFTFPVQSDSTGRYYYAFLELIGTGSTQIGMLPVEVYLNGAAYRDNMPVENQLVFHVVYDQAYWFLDLGRFVMYATGLLMATVLLYVLPGWALLVWLWPEGRLSWAERLGVSAGVSLTLYPLLMLWTDFAHLHLGPSYALLPVIAGVAGILAHYRPWRYSWRQLAIAVGNRFTSVGRWPDITLLMVIISLAVTRLLMVRSLEMPLWDDSVQHTVMVKRILETSGLFQSWLPYAPYHTLSTQFGFASQIAAWSWLTGMDAAPAVIWGGQILNIMAVLTLYPLAHRIKGPWAGAVAVLVGGFFTLFPAHYTNWGRYPQMAGQAILPVAAWWLWMILREEEPVTWLRAVPGAALLIAGMTLTYYRLAFHYLAFGVAAILLVLKCPGKRYLRLQKWLALGAIMGVTAVLMAPWALHIFSLHNPLVTEAASLGTGSEAWSAVQVLQDFAKLIVTYAPTTVLPLLVLGMLVGRWCGGIAVLPALWGWLILSLPLLWLTPLPGVKIIQQVTIATSLYIPNALICGMLAGCLADRPLFPGRWRSVLPAVLIMAAILLRLPSTMKTIDRSYDLSSRPDMRAAEWVKQNLPADSFFLINGIIYTDKKSVVGGDGGWWLPLLTGRGASIPPQYALLAEMADRPGYNEAVNGLVRRLFEVSPASPEGHQAICQFPQPITHVYLGQRDGMVAAEISPPPHPMLPADLLRADPAFRLIYCRDNVRIFEFDRSVCR